jgi:uncharacterized protein
VKTLVWAGADDPRFEVAFLDPSGGGFRARGTQLGTTYRLTYEVETDASFVTQRFAAECETAQESRSIDLRRGIELTEEILDVDLAFSPIFNSLPVLRDGLLDGGRARTYTMAFVDVPELTVSASKQEYTPLEQGVVRYRSGAFVADIVFDSEGLVVDYPQLARRVAVHNAIRI